MATNEDGPFTFFLVGDHFSSDPSVWSTTYGEEPYDPDPYAEGVGA